MKADAISIVEAAYRSAPDPRAWLRGVLEEVGPQFDRGFGVGVAEYEPNIDPDKMRVDGWNVDDKLGQAFRAMNAAYVEIFHRVMTTGRPLDTPTGHLGISPKCAVTWAPYVTFLHPFGVRQVVGAMACDPSGRALVFSTPTTDLRRPTLREVARWSRIAAHISAGARLRSQPILASGDLSAGADAVLSPSGTITHAEVGAQSASAQESLRLAAQAIDRARSKARSNDEEALELWQGLVAGRWSLVDRFDTDGRRYLIARKNDPDVTDPRALTPRERQVLAYTAMGQPLKLIAYSLGISVSSISATRKTAMRKLGLRNHADIVTLLSRQAIPDDPPPHTQC